MAKSLLNYGIINKSGMTIGSSTWLLEHVLETQSRPRARALASPNRR
jgi:hypothetical protein